MTTVMPLRTLDRQQVVRIPAGAERVGWIARTRTGQMLFYRTTSDEFARRMMATGAYDYLRQWWSDGRRNYELV
jgi:hypothetical protein